MEERGVSAWSITEIFSALQTEGVLIFIYTMNRKFNFWNYLSVFCFEWCRFLRFTEVELSRLLIALGKNSCEALTCYMIRKIFACELIGQTKENSFLMTLAVCLSSDRPKATTNGSACRFKFIEWMILKHLSILLNFQTRLMTNPPW